MNYNANSAGNKQPFGKKIKRVPDVNSMGFNPYDATVPTTPQQQQQQQQPQSNLYPNLPPTPYINTGYEPQRNYAMYSTQPTDAPANLPQNFAVFGQPVVQDMALQYGQQLAGAGKSMLKQEVEKYVPVTKLKYYFAVDTKYVMKKLLLLYFPFIHKNWSVRHQQDNAPIQPRYEINAPDLYIPTMAYITYILIAGLVLGMQQRFTPEQIGVTASSALAWCLVELAVYTCTLYLIQVETRLKTLDLLAYSGYKYLGIITSIFFSVVGGKSAYYACLLYVNLALVFFMMRNLRTHVLIGAPEENHSGEIGRKRRMYFLLFVAIVQPMLSWWLSFHLLPIEGATKA